MNPDNSLQDLLSCLKKTLPLLMKKHQVNEDTNGDVPAKWWEIYGV